MIVAVKGIGGMHLACNAADPNAVATLRGRKFREEKPFALMVRDLNRARSLAYVDPAEAELLTSVARPIVILDRKPKAPVADGISPGLDTLGLLLPYTPLHCLLLEACSLDLVMTSGNLSEEPIAFRDDEIVPRLKGLADLFLLHDRPIHLRADDSVVRVVNGRRITLRRSRGYVPDPIRLPAPLKRPILACGAELKSTFCLGRDEYLILSHHIGDLENLAALEAFESGVEHFQRLFYTQPQEIACDLHPDYLSSQYARRTGLPLTEVQHHYAHALAALAETGDFSPALCWTLDGVGLGTDGTLWGGECLLVNGLNWRPVARLRPMMLPGGEKAIREPWRIAVGAIWYAVQKEDVWGALDVFTNRPVVGVLQMLKKKVNCPISSGAGRLFDAVAALAGVREEIVYEGQAAILMEAMAQRQCPDIVHSLNEVPAYSIDVRDDKIVELDWRRMIQEVVRDRLNDLPPGEIGARFHAGLVLALMEATVKLSQRTGLRRVVLTGGVFQNRILLANLWRELEAAGFHVIVPRDVPVNDGSISLGQAVALWLSERKLEDKK
jgi:hydrogenase maturation protein HypF